MEKKLIRPLNMDQVRLLLVQPKTKTYAGFRNWVMVLMMLDSGRRSVRFPMNVRLKWWVHEWDCGGHWPGC